MLTFKEFIVEKRKAPVWATTSAAAIAMKISKLEKTISSESDTKKQNALLAQQNKLIGYLNGLGIAAIGGNVSAASKFRIRK